MPKLASKSAPRLRNTMFLDARIDIGLAVQITCATGSATDNSSAIAAIRWTRPIACASTALSRSDNRAVPFDRCELKSIHRGGIPMPPSSRVDAPLR